MTDYILSLTFDVRQVTQTLQHVFCLAGSGDPCSVVPSGPLAGSFNFQPGDTICPQVTAFVENSDIVGMEVSDFTLVSIGASLDMPLSMFDANNAVNFLDDKGWKPFDPQVGRPALGQKASKAQSVTTEKGQWNFSGYLSVLLKTANGKAVPRLYFFDPEGSTGPIL